MDTQKKILRVVDCHELLDIINNIDNVFTDSFPVIFRAHNEDAEDNGICVAGLDHEDRFVWNDDVLGTIMTLHYELWYDTRIEKIFTDYIGQGSFELLEGSFTGEMTEITDSI